MLPGLDYNTDRQALRLNTCPPTALLDPFTPPQKKTKTHETDDLKNDKQSCTEHLMC